MSRIKTGLPLSGRTSRKSKVLVTGATGLIGKYAVSKLSGEGFNVIAASRSGKGPCGVALDVLNTKAVDEFMRLERPDYLLHLAWNIGPDFNNNAINTDWEASSMNLLKSFALNGGKRAVFAGTCFEYDLRYGFLQEDFTQLNPDTFYGLAKTSLHKLSQAWSENQGFSFAWGHIFFLYGIGERSDRVVPYMVDSFLRGEKPRINYPYILRDYLYADDAAGGLIALMLSDFNGTVNIGSGRAISLMEICEKIALLTNNPVPEYEHVYYTGNVAPLVMADTRRLNGVIGFTPRFSLEEGLTEVIEERKSLLYDTR